MEGYETPTRTSSRHAWREVDRFYEHTRESLAAAWMAVEKALFKREELERRLR